MYYFNSPPQQLFTLGTRDFNCLEKPDFKSVISNQLYDPLGIFIIIYCAKHSFCKTTEKVTGPTNSLLLWTVVELFWSQKAENDGYQRFSEYMPQGDCSEISGREAGACVRFTRAVHAGKPFLYEAILVCSGGERGSVGNY